MTAMYQGEGGPMSVVGQAMQGQLPKPVAAMSQGSQGPVMSDLQNMMANEQRQHEQMYQYANGNGSNGNVPLGQASF